jgi:hypothetical protein
MDTLVLDDNPSDCKKPPAVTLHASDHSYPCYDM